MKPTNSLILEIQRLATDRNQDISDLLRKGLLVASKLKLQDFRKWIDSELNGWKGAVPDYRKARAEIRLKNPYHGLIPFVFEDEQLTDMLCDVEIHDPVESLVHLVRNHKHDGPSPVYSLAPQQIAFLLQRQNGMNLEPVRTLSINKIASVIDAVRTAILEWSLQLEAEGILGENLTFTAEEKSRAASSTHISIGNFQGILGNVEGSTISQKLKLNVEQGDLASLRRYLRESGMEDSDIKDLEVALQSDSRPDKAGAFGPRVSNWMGRMISKAAQGGWTVGIEAAGGLLAAALAAYYGL